MKIKCICGKEGHLQQRGNSARIQHYIGFKDGKRSYEYHNIPLGYLEVNQQSVEVNRENVEVSLGSKMPQNIVPLSNWSLGRDLNPRPTAYKAVALAN